MIRESESVSMPLGTYNVRLADDSSEQRTHAELMQVDAAEYEGAVAVCVSQPSEPVMLRDGVWVPYREDDEYE